MKIIKCNRCNNNKANAGHKCPYKHDINGDKDTLCDCCDECTQNCADDI